MNYFTKITKALSKAYNTTDDLKNVEFIAKGYNGKIELYANKICLKKEGLISLMTEGLKGEKNIMISTISSIQFKKANIITNGYIQFTFMGSKEAKGGMFESVNDENSVLFTMGQQENFEKLRDILEKKIEEKNTPKTTITTAPISNADELMKFAKLRDDGIITEEEFLQKKKEFLG